jgi:hypothetical protein
MGVRLASCRGEMGCELLRPLGSFRKLASNVPPVGLPAGTDMRPKDTHFIENLAEMKFDNENFNEALYLYQRALKIITDEKSNLIRSNSPLVL